jgi:hypothetical protein
LGDSSSHSSSSVSSFSLRHITKEDMKLSTSCCLRICSCFSMQCFRYNDDFELVSTEAASASEFCGSVSRPAL